MSIHKTIRKIKPIELGEFIKKLLNIKRFSHQLPDTEYIFYIDPVSNLGRHLIDEGEYEPETSEVILNLLKLGDTFVDLGTNEGYFTVLASKKVGIKGRVISIEPQQRLWEVITKNLELNYCTNTTLVPYAISDKNEQAEMDLYPTLNNGASAIHFKNNFNIKGGGEYVNLLGVSKLSQQKH